MRYGIRDRKSGVDSKHKCIQQLKERLVLLLKKPLVYTAGRVFPVYQTVDGNHLFSVGSSDVTIRQCSTISCCQTLFQAVALLLECTVNAPQAIIALCKIGSGHKRLVYQYSISIVKSYALICSYIL